MPHPTPGTTRSPCIGPQQSVKGLMRTSKTIVAAAVAIGLFTTACTGAEADPTTTTHPDAEITTAPEPTTTTAASTTTTAEADPTTTTTEPTPPLVLWADETGTAVLRGYIADFQSATGIPIVVETFAADEIVPRIRDMEGTIGGPDLFMGSHRWIAQLQAEGLVAEIKLPFPDTFFPLALDAFTVDGTLYGLPYAIESPALYRNADLVPEAPADFAALIAACETLETPNRCLGVPADDPEVHLAIVNAFGGYGFGYGDNGFDATDVGLDTEGALSGADFINQQVIAERFQEAFGAEAAAELFRLGAEAFFLSGPLPNPGPDNWDAAPFVPPGAQGAAILTEVHGFLILASTTQPMAAQVFLTEFVADENVMFDFFLADFRGPAMKNAYADAVATDARIAAFTPIDADPSLLVPTPLETEALWAALGNALAIIYNQGYSEEVPDAATAFAQTASVLRAGDN